MIIAICTSGFAGAIKLAYIFPEEGHLWKPTREATLQAPINHSPVPTQSS